MCQRDVVSAGRALLDNVHELRDAAITSWRGQSTKFIILKLNNDLEEKSEKKHVFGKKQYFPIPGLMVVILMHVFCTDLLPKDCKRSAKHAINQPSEASEEGLCAFRYVVVNSTAHASPAAEVFVVVRCRVGAVFVFGAHHLVVIVAQEVVYKT